MTSWWVDRNGTPPAAPTGEVVTPQLLGSLTDRRKQLEAYRAGYVPEWTRRDVRDAGVVFRDLLLEMAEPVATRLNRLPEKDLIEFLDVAGMSPLPPTPATAIVAFAMLDSLLESTRIPAGFALSAAAADGSGTVFFETDRALYAAPVVIQSLATQTGNSAAAFTPPSADGPPFAPLGARPQHGAAFLIGFAGTAQVTGSITLLISVPASDAPPLPISAGALEPLPAGPVPTIEWSALDGGSYVPLQVVRDESVSLTRTGLVEIDAPARWRAGDPAGVKSDSPLRWLRARFINGEYATAPKVAFVAVNTTRATAGQTVAGEILTAVSGQNRRQFSVSQVPVLPRSMVLQVDEGPSDDVVPDANGQSFRTWQEVPDLSDAAPDARVYRLDSLSGIVYFGDDIHGLSVPDGFRNVRALTYRVATGAASAVPANQITTLVSSLPGVVSVTNPLPASGGYNGESSAEAIARGPQEIRARSRAVTVADYGLYAQQAPGANVARASAVAAYHAEFPGAPFAGAVTVFVVPRGNDDAPPIATVESLRAVATYLSTKVAPAGIEVVAAVPTFQTVSVSVLVELVDGIAADAAVREITNALDNYLHPVRGGDDGHGWPFGGTILYNGLVRTVMAVTVSGTTAVNSVVRLNYRVDGRLVSGCQDQPIGPYNLLWPANHQIDIASSP